MKGKGGIIAGIITLVIGGTAYSVSQADIVKNFSEDTGMTQEQAQEYVESVSDDDLAAYDEIGADFVSLGQNMLDALPEIDCDEYQYEWESDTLSCEDGKAQLKHLGESSLNLGKGYILLSADDASTEDIRSVILKINIMNASLDQEIVRIFLESSDIDEFKNTNSYNKALLQAALDST
jgi:membrane-associated HD superfamily phosphohydrolase